MNWELITQNINGSGIYAGNQIDVFKLKDKKKQTPFWQKVHHCTLGHTNRKGNSTRLEMCFFFPHNSGVLSLESYCIFLPVQTIFLILPFFHFSKSPPLPHPRSKTVMSLFFRRTLSINSPRKIRERMLIQVTVIHFYYTRSIEDQNDLRTLQHPRTYFAYKSC